MVPVLHLKLRLAHVDLTGVEAARHLDLLGGELLGALVLERADGNHRQAGVDLHRGDGIPRGGTEERLLEIGMRDRFTGAGKAGAELHAGRAHLQVTCHRFAAADAAGHEHQMIRRKARQDFLREDGRGHGADVAARFHALDHKRVRAGAQQLLAERQRGRKADDLGTMRLDRLETALGRDTASQHDMRDAVLCADIDKVEQLRVHGDEVHAEGLGRQRLGGGDFRVQKRRRHRAAGDHTEAARVTDRRNEIAFGHPRHRAAQDRGLATEEFAATRHQR